MHRPHLPSSTAVEQEVENEVNGVSMHRPESHITQLTDKSPDFCAASGARCSVVAVNEEVRGSGPTVTLKINIGPTPALEDKTSDSYLTDNAEREKNRKKALKEQGVTPVVKKKIKYVEEHYDDCGTDICAINYQNRGQRHL